MFVKCDANQTIETGTLEVGVWRRVQHPLLVRTRVSKATLRTFSHYNCEHSCTMLRPSLRGGPQDAWKTPYMNALLESPKKKKAYTSAETHQTAVNISICSPADDASSSSCVLTGSLLNNSVHITTYRLGPCTYARVLRHATTLLM